MVTALLVVTPIFKIYFHFIFQNPDKSRALKGKCVEKKGRKETPVGYRWVNVRATGWLVVYHSEFKTTPTSVSKRRESGEI